MCRKPPVHLGLNGPLAAMLCGPVLHVHAARPWCPSTPRRPSTTWTTCCAHRTCERPVRMLACALLALLRCCSCSHWIDCRAHARLHARAMRTRCQVPAVRGRRARARQLVTSIPRPAWFGRQAVEGHMIPDQWKAMSLFPPHPPPTRLLPPLCTPLCLAGCSLKKQQQRSPTPTLQRGLHRQRPKPAACGERPRPSGR